jgi:hypothetical protein
MPKLDGHRKSARDVSGRISTPARTANLYVQTPRWLRPVDRLDYQIRRRLIPLYVEGSVSALGFGFQLRPSKQESAPSETGRRCGNVRRRNPERPRSGWGHFSPLPHRNSVGRFTSGSSHNSDTAALTLCAMCGRLRIGQGLSSRRRLGRCGHVFGLFVRFA